MPTQSNPGHDHHTSVLCELSSLIRSRGLANAAVIDGHVFFHLEHTPVLYCAQIIEGCASYSPIQALSGGHDLDLMKLTESVIRFIEAPGRFCSRSKGLVKAFLAEWSSQVAMASCAVGTVHKIVDSLLEVEHWLSSDGPGACVITGGFVIWTAGRHGMSDLHIATNIGERPNPDMTTARRWDAISDASKAELEHLLASLEHWSKTPTIWSFKGRQVPSIGRTNLAALS